MGHAHQIEYRLVEAEHVSRAWKLFHLTFLGFAALFGLITGVFLSLMYADDSFLCSDPKILESLVVPKKPFIRVNKSLLTLEIIPHDDTYCEYTQYTMIVSSIFGTIWTVFFLMCGRGGKSYGGLPQPWRIVMPALVFSAIAFGCDLAAATILHVEIGDFCAKLVEELSEYTQEYPTCAFISELYAINNFGLFSSVTMMAYINVSEALCWMSSFAWGLNTVVCLLRIIFGPDFQVVTVTTRRSGSSNSSKSCKTISDNLSEVKSRSINTTHSSNDTPPKCITEEIKES